MPPAPRPSLRHALHFATRAVRRLGRRTGQSLTGPASTPGPRQPWRALTGPHMLTALLALLTGVLAGGGIVLFREGIGLIEKVLFQADHQHLASTAATLPWWLLLLVPTAGGLVVGLWHRLTLPDGRPENVSHVMESAMLRGGRMPLGRGLAAAAGSMLSLGVGASVGREGPAVHLGATLGAVLARTARFGRTRARTLLGCGAAAAVAASFNAPIAGALFAHEVVVGHYATSAFAPVVVASVAGTVVSRLWFGAEPAFALPSDLTLASFLEFPAFALLGLLCGIVAAAFMSALTTTDATVQRSGVPVWLRPAIAGFAVGLIALGFPEVLGVGYEVTNQALNGALALNMAVAILVAKLVATALCLGFGFGGGVFSPSLAMGAVTGCAFGIVATAAVPTGLSSGAGAYAVVGMGAVAAAVLGAPISTSLIIFELTANYALTIAVMTAVVVATLVAHGLTGHRSLFHWQLARRGLNVDSDRPRMMLRGVTVRSVMRSRPPTVPPDAEAAEVAAAFRRHDGHTLCVVEPQGRLIGTIALRDVADALLERPADGPEGRRTALDLAVIDPAVLTPSETLDEAIAVVEDVGEKDIPVVHSRDTMILAGMVQDSALMRAYARAIDHLRAEDRGDR